MSTAVSPFCPALCLRHPQLLRIQVMLKGSFSQFFKCNFKSTHFIVHLVQESATICPKEMVHVPVLTLLCSS